jgi:hypothetical protein
VGAARDAGDATMKAPTGLTCSFNEPWMGDHPLCRAEVEAGCQRFAEAVAAGIFDAQGYRPSERRAQAKRATKVGTLVPPEP